MPFILAALCILGFAGRQTPPAGHFRVLLVGESYEGNTLDLVPLHGPRDCDAMQEAIKAAYGGRNPEFHVLRDKPKRAEIVDEWDQWLTKDAGPDDTMVFFFSGHGTLAHDSTGVCSAVIPSDVAKSASGAFDDGTLLTRGFFNSRLRILQDRFAAAYKKPPNITLIFDACQSGSIARGDLVPKMAINPGVSLRDLSGPRASTDLDLGDAVIIAAAATDKVAYENRERQIGNLTMALTSALAQFSQNHGHSAGDLSYAALRDLTIGNMAALATDDPQLPVFAAKSLQQLDRQVFGEKPIPNEPLFTVSVNADSKSVGLTSGTIFGLRPSVLVGLYRPSTAVADARKPDAIAEVVSATPYTAVLRAAAGSMIGPEFNGGSARIIDGNVDALVDVDASLLNDPSFATYWARLSSQKLVRVASGSGGALLIIPPGSKPSKPGYEFSTSEWIVATPNGHTFAKHPGEDTPENIESWLEEEVRNIGRAHAVLAMSSPDPWLTVEMQLVPATTRREKDAQGKPYEVVTGLEANAASGSSTCGDTERVVLRVRASWPSGPAPSDPLKNAPYAAVLDVTANKNVSMIWPRSGGVSFNQERTRIPLDRNWRYLSVDNTLVDESELAQMEAWYFRPELDGEGQEIFKLCVTSRFVDYTPLLTRVRSGVRGAGDELRLAKIMAAFRDGLPITRDAGDATDPVTTDFAVAAVAIQVRAVGCP